MHGLGPGIAKLGCLCRGCLLLAVVKNPTLQEPPPPPVPAPTEEVRERAMARELLELRRFKADPWFAIEQGWIKTQDEHGASDEETTKPFPPKDYLKYISSIVVRSQVGLLMKSRQMLLSWLFCWLLLWTAVSRKGQLCIAQGKREEDVLAKGDKALMGRIRFMRRNLPPHVRPRVLEETKGAETYFNGSTIIAIPQGPDVIRSLTASFVFMDELAFHPEGEQAWTAALPTIKGGGRLWGVTTPNGHEFCYSQADDRLKWDGWEKWPQALDGLHGYQNTKGMQLLALHYTADPEKRTPEHQSLARAGYTDINLYRRENELDFSLQPGEPVFGEFRKDLHCLSESYKVNPKLPIFRGWDSSYNGQATVFLQINHKGQVVIFDCVFFKRVPLEDHVREVQKRTLLHLGQYDPTTKGQTAVEIPLYDLEGHEIPGAHLARIKQIVAADVQDFGDPASEAHNTQGETVRQTLATFGITLHSKVTTGRKLDLIEQVRALLLPRSDGTPGLLVSTGPQSEMQLIVKGFLGGYAYPESQLGRAEKQRPHKDGTFDHLFDALQYAIDWLKPSRAAMVEDEFLEGEPYWKDAAWRDNPWGPGNQDDLRFH